MLIVFSILHGQVFRMDYFIMIVSKCVAQLVAGGLLCYYTIMNIVTRD